jgi:hypothetical protein
MASWAARLWLKSNFLIHGKENGNEKLTFV